MGCMRIILKIEKIMKTMKGTTVKMLYWKLLLLYFTDYDLELKLAFLCFPTYTIMAKPFP